MPCRTCAVPPRARFLSVEIFIQKCTGMWCRFLVVGEGGIGFCTGMWCRFLVVREGGIGFCMGMWCRFLLIGTKCRVPFLHSLSVKMLEYQSLGMRSFPAAYGRGTTAICYL